jgi:hypothetical protein
MGNEESKKHPLFGRAPLTDESIYVGKTGYYQRTKDHKYVHRIIYYNAVKKTPPMWHVHHINGEKLDNRLDNLIALPPEIHQKLHERWPMSGLPSRYAIIGWWHDGAIRGRRKKKKRPTPSQSPNHRLVRKQKKRSKKRRKQDQKVNVAKGRGLRHVKEHFLKTGEILDGFDSHPMVRQTLGEWERQRLRFLYP